MSNDTLESRAREAAESAHSAWLYHPGMQTETLIECISKAIAAFAKAERERALEEAVEAVDKMSWMAPETDDVLEAVTRCNVEIRTDVIRVIEALKGGDA